MPLQNVLIAPELQYLDPSRLQSTKSTMDFRDSYLEAYLRMLYPSLPPETAPGNSGYLDYGAYQYPAYSYPEPVNYLNNGNQNGYAWMSKLINWSANK